MPLNFNSQLPSELLAFSASPSEASLRCEFFGPLGTRAASVVGELWKRISCVQSLRRGLVLLQEGARPPPLRVDSQRSSALKGRARRGLASRCLLSRGGRKSVRTLLRLASSIGDGVLQKRFAGVGG